MLHKKSIFSLLIISISLCLGACSLLPQVSNRRSQNKSEDNSQKTSSKHVHSAAPNAEWQYNSTKHWKDCVENDGGKVDSANHEFEVTDEKEPTYQSNGIIEETCAVCGYVKTTTIPRYAGTYTITPNYVGLQKSSGDIYLYIDSTFTEVACPIEDISVAFGLIFFEANSSGPSGYSNRYFVVGNETPTDSDYVSINENNISNISSNRTSFDYRFLYKLSGASFKNQSGLKGMYGIYFGSVNDYALLRVEYDNIRQSDSTYRYNYRRDSGGTGSVTALVIEEKPLFSFEEVNVYQDNESRVWMRLGGPLKAGVSYSQLSESPFIRFQEMSSYKHLQYSPEFNNSTTNKYFTENNYEGELWYYESVNNKAYIHILIDFMVASQKYNIHLNVKEGITQDCVLDVDGPYSQKFTFNNDSRIFTAHYDPTGPHEPDNIYGNFGFIVTSK